MAFDTPARIAIVGAGPIGLEVALYARFLGYDVDVYEQGQICQHVRKWQDIQLFTPFGWNCSTLGLAALSAQDPGYHPPQTDQLVTGREWLAQYLLPLSQTDLVADHIHTETKVIQIARQHLRKAERVGGENRDEYGFRLLLQSKGRDENTEADIVIDTSGVLSQPNWIGEDGAPAVGEIATQRKNVELPLEQKFWHTDIPVGTEQTAKFANKSVLVLGSGCSAATTIRELSELATNHTGTKVTWLTRHATSSSQPIRLIEKDRLPLRVELVEAINQLAASETDWLRHLDGTWVESISFDESQARCRVRLSGKTQDEMYFDQVIANTGYRPDPSIFRELQVQLCYATEALMALGAEFASDTEPDRLSSQSAASLVTTEPNFYVLGAKSYGRNSNFLYADGLEQIRHLFALIGDRAELDLYASSKNLLPKD